MKIRQSYHGTGDMNGYKYEVCNDCGVKIGDINDFPVRANSGNTVELNGDIYKIIKIYDCPLPESEDTEVVWITLKPFEFKADFNLGFIEI